MTFSTGDFREWAYRDDQDKDKTFKYKSPCGRHVWVELKREDIHVHNYDTDSELKSFELVCSNRLINILHSFDFMITKQEGNTTYVPVNLDFTVTEFSEGLNIITTTLEALGIEVEY